MPCGRPTPGERATVVVRTVVIERLFVIARIDCLAATWLLSGFLQRTQRCCVRDESGYHIPKPKMVLAATVSIVTAWAGNRRKVSLGAHGSLWGTWRLTAKMFLKVDSKMK